MPNKSERRQHRSFRRTASGTKMITKMGKHSKQHCALCDAVLHGVSHGKTNSERRKQSKTQKRPTGYFAGILCNGCRTMIIKEAAKVKAGVKNMGDVRLDYRPYIAQVEKRVN